MSSNEGFEELLANFQEKQDNTIVDNILAYLEIDLSRYEVKGEDGYISGFTFPREEMYISYKIKNLRQRLFKTLGITTSSELDDILEGFYWFRKDLHEHLGLDLNPGDGFKVYYEHKEYLKDYLGIAVFVDFEKTVIAYENVLKENVIRQEINDMLIKPCLIDALKSVNIEKSVKEIVKYTNKTFYTKFVSKQQEIYGIKRLGRVSGSKYHNVFVVPNLEKVSPWRMVYGDIVNKRTVTVDLLYAKLTEAQRELVDKLIEIIEDDFKQKERSYLVANYKVDEFGEFQIKFRYLADRLDIEESNLRKRVRTIQKKVAY